MSFEHKDKVWSGRTSDVLLLVKALAEQMVESDLREAEVYLPFDTGDTTVRMKR